MGFTEILGHTLFCSYGNTGTRIVCGVHKEILGHILGVHREILGQILFVGFIGKYWDTCIARVVCIL